MRQPRSSLIRPALLAFAVVFAMVVAIVLGVGSIKRTLDDAFSAQRAIAEAQRFSALVVRAQLDEELGLRGFVASGRTMFLAPYRVASAAMPTTVAYLEDALVRADLAGERPFVAEASALNESWRMTVARPMLANRRRRDMQFLAVRGKTLVDRYRAALGHVERALVRRAAAETEAATLAVSRVGLVAVSAVMLVGAITAISLRRQSQLGRKLIDERRITYAMQRGLLQESLPTIPGIAVDASYVPAGREALVGGDWYDVYVLRDGRVMFAIGDVAGHGIAAAVVMSRAREAIVALGTHSSDPASVLARANDVLVLQQSTMATAIFGYVDPRARTMVYASAGHPPPLFVDAAGSASFLPYSGVPLGLMADQQFVNHSVVASGGSTLFFYTDGFTERTRDMLAGERALLEAAPTAIAQGPGHLAWRMHRRIFGEAPPNDDAAMLTFAFATPRAERADAAVARVAS